MNVWAVTDKGIVRSQNQDSCFMYRDDNDDTSILLVCDGMGGARAGNVASKLAEKVFMNELTSGALKFLSPEMLKSKIRAAIMMANTAVYELGITDTDCRGMGTTLVSAVLTGDKVTVVNVGDSRAYHIKNDKIEQITRDHSVVEDMIRRGDLTREESKTHPHKNLITRAVGTAPSVDCDFFELSVKDGEYILLCTDGLTNIVTDEEILETVCRRETVASSCTELLDMALKRGAPDNVTVVLLKI